MPLFHCLFKQIHDEIQKKDKTYAHEYTLKIAHKKKNTYPICFIDFFCFQIYLHFLTRERILRAGLSC
jgi:hypothetical protein